MPLKLQFLFSIRRKGLVYGNQKHSWIIFFISSPIRLLSYDTYNDAKYNLVTNTINFITPFNITIHIYFDGAKYMNDHIRSL